MLKKLSLAAIIAVSGVSFASATPLTDAIKNVDLSGFARIRFYNESKKDVSGNDLWRVSGLLKFTIPASETIKIVNAYSYDQKVQSNASGTNDSAGDKTIALSKLFLNYNNNGLNAIIGKIPVETSITGSGFGEATGVGAIAAYKVNDMATFAAGYVDSIGNVKATGVDFETGNIHTGVDLSNGNDIYTAAVIVKPNEMVSANLWYYHVTNLVKDLYTVSLNVKPIENLILHGDYAASKLDSSLEDMLPDDVKGTKKYYNVSIKYSQSGACVKVGYASTDKKVGVITLDDDAPIAAVATTANNYSIANLLKTSTTYAKVGYNVDSSTKVYLAYQHQKGDADYNYYVDSNGNNVALKLNELTVGGSYKYNKKLSFSGYYDVADWNDNTRDNRELRLEAKYSF